MDNLTNPDKYNIKVEYWQSLDLDNMVITFSLVFTAHDTIIIEPDSFAVRCRQQAY